MVERWRVAVISVCIVLAVVGWISSFLSLLPKSMSDLISITASVLGASFIGFSAFNSLKEGIFGVDVLATVAVVVSIVLGEFLAAAMVAIMLGGGEILESFAFNRASRAIQKLVEASPKTAIVLRDGKEVEVKIEEVKSGETVIVRPGGKIPVDGVIANGQATINQSSVTGESVPIEKTTGDRVYSGTLVELGALEIRVTAVGEESTYGKIIAMVRDAEENRSPIERTADRYAKYFTPIILVLGALTYLITGDPLRLASIFVIACPCALVLATPTAVVASIGNSARRGILIRNGEILEKLGKVDVLVMDKTGTVTMGRLEVVDIKGFGHDKAEILRLAATAEKLSEHPIAKAVLRKAMEMKVELETLKNFEVRPGLGVRIENKDGWITVGNEKMLNEYSIHLGNEAKTYLRERLSGTTIFVAKNESVIGVLSLTDTIREDAKGALNKAKINGVAKTVMLTGDNSKTARAVGEQIGVDEVRSDLLPSDKVSYIKELKSRGHSVAMVGDGINDAPALAASDVGVAMGLGGTDMAIETAGVILATDDLNSIPKLFRISRETIKIIKLNIAIAMTVNIAGIALSASGVLPPFIAAVIHESNALVGMINSLSLLRVD